MRMKPYEERDGKRVWLSRNEIQRLLDNVEEHESTKEQIAVKLAVRGGLRRKEIVQIQYKDLVTDEHNNPRIRVWEKVAKKEHYREPPIPEGLATQIETMADIGGLGPEDELIDVSDRTVYRWVRRACNRLKEQTGDEGWDRVDVHDLRRSWATHILEEGVLASVVMEWGGWRDWDTFRRHYLGEFSPRVLRREREKVEYLADGDPIESEPIVNTTVPTSGGQYGEE